MIYGIKGRGKSVTSEVQALRYPKDIWTEASARAHCKDRGGTFEAAKKADKQHEESTHMEKIETIKIPTEASLFQQGMVFLRDVDKGTGKARFRMNAYSGEVIQNHWWWGNLIIDLAGMEVPKKSIPALRDHDSARIIGWTDRITKSNDEGLTAEGFFSRKTRDGREARELSIEGFPWQASIYIPPKSVEEVKEGVNVKVNGKSLAGPLTIFRQSVLREVSFCALGADMHTSAQALKDKGDIQVQKIIKQEEETMKLTVDILKDDHPDLVEALSQEARAEVTLDDFGDEISGLRDEAVKAETARIMGIFKEAYGEETAAKFEKIIQPGATVVDFMAFAQDKAKADMLAKMTAEAPESVGQGDGDNPPASQLQGEEKWKDEFSKSQELQAEFGGKVERYIAFKQADSEGRVKILKSKKS